MNEREHLQKKIATVVADIKQQLFQLMINTYLIRVRFIPLFHCKHKFQTKSKKKKKISKQMNWNQHRFSD